MYHWLFPSSSIAKYSSSIPRKFLYAFLYHMTHISGAIAFIAERVTGRFAHFPVRTESFRPQVVSPSITWVVSPSYPESFRPLPDESFRPLSIFFFIEDLVKNLQFLFPSMKILLYFFKKWQVLHQLKQMIHIRVFCLSCRANWVIKMSFEMFLYL